MFEIEKYKAVRMPDYSIVLLEYEIHEMSENIIPINIFFAPCPVDDYHPTKRKGEKMYSKSAFSSILFIVCLFTITSTTAISPIENPQNKFLVWNDYKIEINQYGGLGRDYPHGIVWEQYKILEEKARITYFYFFRI